MADKLVKIAQFEDYIQAELAKQLLEDFGIKAFVTGGNVSNVYSIPTLGWAEIQVPQSESNRALEILNSAPEKRNGND